jgi:hypothetical protein
MRAALADDCALDFRAADGAWFPGTPVHPKMILKIAAAVDPVDAGAIATDTFFERLAYCRPETLCLFFRDLIRLCEWMKFREMEGLVRVNVAEAGDEFLIEQ